MILLIHAPLFKRDMNPVTVLFRKYGTAVFVAAACAFAIGVPRLVSTTYLLIKPAYNISFY